MDRILTGQGMKSVDNYTIQKVGIPSMVLMERVALGVTNLIKDAADKNQRILCICGTGNNGADAVAVARQLVCEDYKADVVILGDDKKCSEEFILQKNIAKSCNVNFLNTVTTSEGDAYNYLCKALRDDYDIVVDGIFGIGLSRDIQGVIKDFILEINDIKKYRNEKTREFTVIAVDIPSGLNSSTGEVMGTAVDADVTVTFGSKKAGMYLYKGKDVCGQIIALDIGFPKHAYEEALTEMQSYSVIEKEDIIKQLPRRAHSNKGTYGKVLIVAGSKGMYGAACLAATAAFRVGTGLVKIITHEKNRDLIYTMLPEAMIEAYKDADDISESAMEKNIEWADSVLVGPGIGDSNTAKSLVSMVMKLANKHDKYLVIDADGLNIIAKDTSLKEYYFKKTILTPHIGEASRLMGLDISYIARNIIKVADEYARENVVNVVLKDSTSVILGIESLEDKCNNRAYVNITGNAGMATAGSGDILAGIIAGIVAGSLDRNLVESDLTKAIAIAVFIHGMAGDIAADEKGQICMVATDILDMIAKVLNI